MAARVEIFDVECAASTPASAPLEVAVAFDPGLVEKVEVIIPDGHAGLTGIALAVAHQPVIPFNRRSEVGDELKFIEGNDEEIPFKLDDYPDSGQWSAFVFNTDVNAHKWQLRFEIAELARGGAPIASAPAPLATSPAGEVVGGEAEPIGGVTAPPPPPAEEPTTTPPSPPPEEGAVAPPVEGAEPEAPILAAPPSEGGEPEGGAALPAPGTAPSPRPKLHPGARPAKSRFVLRVTHEELPAGGWLPRGARYEFKKYDQGVDFVTAWKGEIIAPGSGRVVHNLSDRPFPDGFGPRYPVVHIDSGRFGGRDWYLGHTTSAVRAGERFEQGHVLAHADQGHRDGGGWVELGPAPGGVPEPGQGGAAVGHLFSPLRITHTQRVEVRSKGVRPPKPKGPTHVLRKPPPPRGEEHRGAPPPHAAPRPGAVPRHSPGPARVPAPAAHGPGAAPRVAPPPRRPVPPPPPPRPRPPAPRPVRRR